MCKTVSYNDWSVEKKDWRRTLNVMSKRKKGTIKDVIARDLLFCDSGGSLFVEQLFETRS